MSLFLVAALVLIDAPAVAWLLSLPFALFAFFVAWSSLGKIRTTLKHELTRIVAELDLGS